MNTTGNDLPVFNGPEPPPILNPNFQTVQRLNKPVIDLIKQGKFPSVEGMHFTDAELEQIQVALKIRGDAIARYFEYVKSQSAINI